MAKPSIIRKVDRIKISQSTLKKTQLHVHVLNIKVKIARNLLAVISTGKNNGFPFLDFLGYLKNTPKKSQIWQSETSHN